MDASDPLTGPYRVALVYPDDDRVRGRFLPLFPAFRDLGMQAEPLHYRDGASADLRRRLLEVDGALVWVNPIQQDRRGRAILDGVLREVAAAGVFVSAHPDVIQKMGTKEVLHTTRDIGWGSDVQLYRDAAQLRRELPAGLSAAPRVLKRLRGNGGRGVWRVELDARAPSDRPALRVRQASRGSIERPTTLEAFYRLCEAYLAADGGLIDQAWQPRLPEGMIRCYLVHDRVEGFGHQAVNALVPALAPGPRLYHPPTLAAFRPLKRRLEREWVPALQRLLGIETARLPVLWDCDFLLGHGPANGDDGYVLCEINASSVAPFPESAVPAVARATLERVRVARRERERA